MIQCVHPLEVSGQTYSNRVTVLGAIETRGQHCQEYGSNNGERDHPSGWSFSFRWVFDVSIDVSVDLYDLLLDVSLIKLGWNETFSSLGTLRRIKTVPFHENTWSHDQTKEKTTFSHVVLSVPNHRAGEVVFAQIRFIPSILFVNYILSFFMTKDSFLLFESKKCRYV
jgi:hypothetical protein